MKKKKIHDKLKKAAFFCMLFHNTQQNSFFQHFLGHFFLTKNLRFLPPPPPWCFFWGGAIDFEGGPSKFISAPPQLPPPQKMAPPQCPPLKTCNIFNYRCPPPQISRNAPPQNDSPSKWPPLNGPPSKKTPCPPPTHIMKIQCQLPTNQEYVFLLFFSTKIVFSFSASRKPAPTSRPIA